MRVVIDTSVIGLAQLFETARTGIYRVISSLSEELLKQPDYNIRFCSLSSLEVNALTEKYFQHRGLGQRAFGKNYLEKMLAASCKTPCDGRLKIIEKILSRIYRISLSQRITSQVDIYHSMYAQVPNIIRKKTISRILTIYDIIPFLHPDYFEEGFVDQFRPIVESIDCDRDCIITISECSKNDICNHFSISPERVFVTPLAASPKLYFKENDKKTIDRVRSRYHIPSGRYFLTLATVEKRKNLITSIKSFKRVIRECNENDLYFVLVGTRGWKIDDIYQELDKDNELRKRVIFTGFVPDQYLSALYSGAEAFLFPSLYEGFGLPPLEAMQCGVPVITSNTSSLPEVVGDAGITVDPLDEHGIAQGMLDLLHNGKLKDELAERGLRRAKLFSWEKCAEQTIDAYKIALNYR